MLSENIRIIRKSEGLSREGMSVPDAGLRIALTEALETPVSTLLGVTTIESTPDDLQALCEKLERINAQFAQRKTARRKAILWLLVRFAPIIFIAALIGIFLTWKKR